jgi:hypothetical protein
LIPLPDPDALCAPYEEAKEAVRRALEEDDPGDLHAILFAGYVAAILVFREPKLWPLARALGVMLDRGDPKDHFTRPH